MLQVYNQRQNNYNSQNLCPLIHNLRHCNLLDVRLSPLNMWPSHVTIVHINLWPKH